MLTRNRTDLPATQKCNEPHLFYHIRLWAESNGMVINRDKTTKELVLHRPHPSKHILAHSLEAIERVHAVKLLGVILFRLSKSCRCYFKSLQSALCCKLTQYTMCQIL